MGATARLLLEPLRVAHAAEMVEVLATPELHRFTGGGPPDLLELEQRYRRLEAGSPDLAVRWCNWVLRLRVDLRAIGYVQATLTDERQGRHAELAWVVGAPWQGQGYASEATAWLLEEVRRLGAERAVAHIAPANGASAAVARRLGMRGDGMGDDGEQRWAVDLQSRQRSDSSR